MFATPIKFISTIFFAMAASSVLGAYAPDEITSLPGWTGALPSKQYSGYLNFTSSGTTNHIHYWLVTSESSTAATDPIVVWFNGGPGCSSLDGFVYEQGPFEFNSDATVLTLRPYRWNLIANVLFIEQPVGVGFSYNENAKYHLNDDKAANDNLQAIETFYALYPEYKNNKFFITGESYAGVYVPTLAESILKATEAGTYTGATLTGIAVGNGCSGTEVGICGSGPQGTYYEWSYLTQTSFVQLQLKNQINAQCNWTAAAANQPNALSNACVALLNQASAQIGHVNLYDIYGDCVDSMCTNTMSYDAYSRLSKAEIKALNLPRKSKVPPRPDIVGYDEPNPSAQRRLQRIIPHGPDACIDSKVASAYFNRADVQAAIHVRDPGYCWAVCNDAPGWTYQSTRTNLPANTYPYLNSNIQVVIYNGDWDACVPYTDGYGWTNGMNYPVQTEWHAWNYTSGAGNPGQVAGYAIQYNVAASTNKNLRANVAKGQNGNSFTFVTVKGGRHEVPESAGYQALQMLTNIINNTPF